MKASLGLDFGTLSVRALVVGLDGQELGSASCDYARGVITGQLPTCGDPLPPDSAFQHPDDWLDSAATAIQGAVRMAGQHELLGIGVAFTSCTMLPLLKDGRPLCLAGGFEWEPQAWPKLWKHHGAIPQAVRMTTVARERGESFLARYGGVIGEEWLFPKILEAIESAPRVADAAAWWMEAGDWVVWQMTGGEPARSTCQAGYKGLWSAEDGDVSNDYLAAVHPRLPAEAAKLPRRMRVPGEAAGLLCPALAERFGIPADIPVGAAAIDAHAGVPGAGE
jgi:L-ribulokinase